MRWIIAALSVWVSIQVYGWGRQKERTWYVKGKPVQATQYAVNGDKVHLFTVEDWPEPRVVFIRDLSRADQEYIKSGKKAETKREDQPPVCPMLSMKVSADIGRKTDKGQGVTLLTEVALPEGHSYEGKVSMKVLLIAKGAGSSLYTVVDTKTFLFPPPNAEPLQIDFNFIIRPVKGASAIPKYAGYLVVVSDETGRQVALESFPATFKKNSAKLLTFSKGDGFDQRFKSVPRK